MKTMKVFKKVFAMMLAMSVLLSTVLTVAASEAEENKEPVDSSIFDLLNLDSENPLTGEETAPFISAPDSSILMTKENELLLYTSNKKGLSTKDDLITIFEKMVGNTHYTKDSGVTPELDLFFVTAVALNASGNGTDDHVAYLGVKAFDNNDGGANAGRSGQQVLMVVLYNARDNRVVDTIEIGDVKSWASSVEHYSYKTLFSITAGDYDGDGIDEIACTDHNMGVQMLEINTSGSDLSLIKSQRYDWTDLVSEEIAAKMKKSVTSTAEYNRRAFISLATGNFDGTGAEELATAVSTNHPGDDDFLPEIPEAYTTQLAMLASPMSNDANIKTLVVHSTYASSDEEEQDNVVHRVIYVGQITAGDIDGDRRDEIVVAGYTGEIEVTEKGKFVDGRYEYDNSNIALCYAKLDGNYLGLSEITIDAMTPFIEEGFFDSATGLVPLSIDAAKLHGQYGKESVFVGGKVYQFSTDRATSLYTHEFFKEESSWWYTDAYVEHVTSGVFGGPDYENDNKPLVNEQFVFTIVEKDNSQNEYNYKVGFISVSTNQETNSSFFVDNTSSMEKFGYLLEERPGGMKTDSGNADTSYGTALVPVAVDIDDDGLLVKHTNTTYFYEDPSVEAVLQAAPYFEELGGYDNFEGSTTYSVSVSRSLIDVWGHTHSIHTGLKLSAGKDDAFSLDIKVGYALDMDFSHEKAYTTTYTTTFEAGPYDTVVVQRTPYICYEYSFVDINGNLLTGDAAGTVVLMEAMQPVYFQLSVDEYNRFVDEYNAIAERHDKHSTTADGKPVENTGDSYRLVKITEDILPSNATGNPENYDSYIRGGEYISQGTYALSTNGGATSSEFSYEVEQSYTATYAHGMHLEAEATFGAGVVTAGGFVSTSFQETCGYGEATINGTGTGGTVANINFSNYSEIEQDTLKLYGFNWRCAMWKKCLITDADGNPYLDANGKVMQIPVVGYVVTNIKRPMAAPTGVNAYLSGNGYQVTVDWEPSVSGTDKLLGYYVYRSCDNQDSVLVNSDILPSTSLSFVDTSVLKPGKIYTYYVVARYASGGIEYTTMNPKSSAVVWGVPQLSEDTLASLENGNDMYAASIFGIGSVSMVIAILALGASAASIGLIINSKKKKSSDESKEET
ncbi:MAG: fibronectin type III domain-containing protein [Clostridia bacterium]|nr:fibronectin type III domain-containing protein [Clostridia bacterium]